MNNLILLKILLVLGIPPFMLLRIIESFDLQNMIGKDYRFIVPMTYWILLSLYGHISYKGDFA